MHLTIPKTFIRFVGNSLDPTDYTRCDDWVKRIKYWLGAGMQELYFFMHMHDEAYSPELTHYLTKKLNAACKLDLPVPVLLSRKKSRRLSPSFPGAFLILAAISAEPFLFRHNPPGFPIR